MKKSEFEYPNNLVKLAAAMGTKEQEKTGKTKQQIQQILTTGVADIQAKLIMLEAAKIVMIKKKNLAKRVDREFLRICKELGLEDMITKTDG